MFILTPSARAAERGRWAHRRKGGGASGVRAICNIGLWLCGKVRHPFAPRGFFGLWLCCSWCVGLFKLAGVPSGRGASRSGLAAPSGFCHGFRPMRSVQVFGWVVGEASSLPEAQPGAQGDAGCALACFPRVPSARAP